MESIKTGNVISIKEYQDNIKTEDLRAWRLEQLMALEEVVHPLHTRVVAGALVNHFELLKELHDGDAESDFMVDIYGTPVAIRIDHSKVNELVYEFICFQRKTEAKDSPTFMSWKVTPTDPANKEGLLANAEYPVEEGYIPRLREFSAKYFNEVTADLPVGGYVSPLLMLMPTLAATLPHAPEGTPPFKVLEADIVGKTAVVKASNGDLDLEIIFDVTPCESSI